MLFRSNAVFNEENHTLIGENEYLFRQDAVEMTAHYLGIRMNEAILAALEALDEQDMELSLIHI